MKALSLWQPWASLMVAGLKRVETRGWAIKYRGPLLIHAAKKWSADIRRLAGQQPFRDALRGLGCPLGAIVGRVEVVECFRAGVVSVAAHNPAAPYVTTWAADGPDNRSLRISETERAFGDYTPGRYAFLCAMPVRFADPIPFKGHQSLFDVPDSVIADARGAA